MPHQEGFAGCRQLDLAAVTLEQPDPNSSLQLLDLTAQRRLSHLEPFGGSSKMQFLREHHKGTDLVQGEHDAIKLLNTTMPVRY